MHVNPTYATPYPYLEREVIVPNKEAGVNLAGTLTIPTSASPFPAIVFITGSGAQNPDQEILQVPFVPGT